MASLVQTPASFKSMNSITIWKLPSTSRYTESIWPIQGYKRSASQRLTSRTEKRRLMSMTKRSSGMLVFLRSASLKMNRKYNKSRLNTKRKRMSERRLKTRYRKSLMIKWKRINKSKTTHRCSTTYGKTTSVNDRDKLTI